MDEDRGFLDDLRGWWSDVWTDDPTSGPYDEWGTGSPGDLSPGLGNRWIARNTEYDDLGDLVLGGAKDLAKGGGEIVGEAAKGAVGVPPAVLLGGALLLFLAFRKATS